MTTATLQRAICPVCGKSQKVRKTDGKICKHGKCSGGGQDPETKTKTHVAIALDDSYSMYNIQHGAIKAFNNLCDPLRKQDDYTVTFTMFSHQINHIWKRDAKDLPYLTDATYRARGNSTRLWDAVANAIRNLVDDNRSSYLVIVITDGFENASSTPTKHLTKMIKEKQATDRWTFAFSCPGGHAKRLAETLQIPLGNFEEWEQTDRGVTNMGYSNKSAVSRYTQNRSKGVRSVQNFYVNIGREDTTKVAKKLKEAPAGRFKKLKTTKACEIRPFIESKKLHFVKGCAYYQLQKPEKVQSYKNIVLERKDTGKLFAGPEVRETLGIPQGQDGRVKPGNLGEWNVYVQSTSVNRKLLAKMDLLFDTQL